MPERARHVAAFFVACALLPVVELPAAPSASSPATPPNDSVGPARTYQLRAAQARRAPTIDGQLKETIWQNADVATGFTQFKPNPGQPASRPTRIRILYHDEALYVGARLYDAPASVVARVAQRDDFGYSDRLFVFFDLFFSGGTNQEADWDAVWTASAHTDALGWTAEMRIPLNQLSFDPKKRTATWGFNAIRDIARYDQRTSWTPLDPTAGAALSRRSSVIGSDCSDSPRSALSTKTDRPTQDRSAKRGNEEERPYFDAYFTEHP